MCFVCFKIWIFSSDNGSHNFTVEGVYYTIFPICPNQTLSINNVIVMFLQTKTSTVDILESLDKVCSPLLSCPFKPRDFIQPL